MRPQAAAPSVARPLVAALALAVAASPAAAQPASPAGMAYDAPAAASAPEVLKVVSSAIKAGDLIAPEYSGYGRNLSPPVSWSGQPPGVKSYVLVVQDSDSLHPQPTLHWLAYDIPPDLGALPPRLRNRPELDKPEGMLQGPNSHGGVGWTGPHPPVGDPPHHYHFQLFALNAKLKLKGGASLDRVLGAMRGHVIARGQEIGLFAQAAPSPPKR